MGALRGSSTYLRFFVDGDPPDGMGDLYEQAIEARRFAPLAPDSPDDTSAGWVPIDAPFEDDIPITRDRFWLGEHIALAYREDKIVVPRSVLSHHVKKRCDALEAEGEKLTKPQRKSVELAVLAELRQRLLPRARTLDLIWDPGRREVRVFGRGPMATERCAALFERTFSLRMTYAHYATRAFAMDLSMRARAVLEQLSPEHLFDDLPPPVEHSLLPEKEEE